MSENKTGSFTTLGERIAERRKAKEFSLQQVAIKVGVTKSTIQRYESGAIHTVKQPVVEAIAKALSTSAEYLMGQTDDPAPAELDAFTYALFNETQPLTQANKEKLLEMARFFRHEQEKEQGS